MKFSNEKPPVFDRLKKVFGVEWGGDLVVAYKDTIYHSKPLHPSVIIHEQVHLNRQEKNPDEWWSRYLSDTKFRLGEELLAYRAQYRFIQSTHSDRNQVAKHLAGLASALSSSQYGKIIAYSDALKLIKMK